jgi:AIG2-like family
MDFQQLSKDLLEWVFAHRVAVSIVALIALLYGGVWLYTMYQRHGFYVWYFVLFAAALVGTFTPIRLYCYTFILGMATAFAEIISKFRDEPIKTLRMPHALWYHLLNGAVAAFALKILVVFSGPERIANGQEQFKSVLAAGLGSMLIMRSKLFNIKQLGGEDISFGPEQIVKIYFRFMEAAIDRLRAQDRIEFVKKNLGNINPIKVFDYSETMLLASQALEDQARQQCIQGIQELNTGNLANLPSKLRSYRLGFLLLNNMGEDFVIKVFENAPPDWLLEAPIQESKSTVVDKLPFQVPFLSTDPKDKPIPYMAYGSSMNSLTFRERLGKQWQELDETKFRDITKARKCELSGYKLVFNGYQPSQPDNGSAGVSEQMGLANIVKSPNDKMEGVLYDLTKDVIEFLDRTESGYYRDRATVMVDGKPVEADFYVCRATRESVAATAEYLQLVVEGAKAFGLSEGYVNQLKAMENAPVS